MEPLYFEKGTKAIAKTSFTTAYGLTVASSYAISYPGLTVPTTHGVDSAVLRHELL